MLKNFSKYFGKKLLWYLLTFVVALMLNFFLPRLIPGNPVDGMIADSLAGITDSTKAAAIRQEFIEKLGLNKSMFEQFVDYVKGLFRGDLGVSFTNYPRPVLEIISTKIPWTIAIQLPSILIGWVIGNLLGAVAAYKKGVFDKIIFPFSLLLSSIPAFVLGMVLLLVFGVNLNWFPVLGGYSSTLIPSASFEYIWSLFRHWQLPFISTCLVMIGGQAIGMRSMSLYELNADYVLYAKLLGIPDKKVTRYVFRNAVLPQITGLALSLGTMVGGALITEIVFSYPGIGQEMMKAIRNIDYPLISGCTLVISITVLVANFLIEIIYGLIDPRVRSAQNEEG